MSEGLKKAAIMAYADARAKLGRQAVRDFRRCFKTRPDHVAARDADTTVYVTANGLEFEGRYERTPYGNWWTWTLRGQEVYTLVDVGRVICGRGA